MSGEIMIYGNKLIYTDYQYKDQIYRLYELGNNSFLTKKDHIPFSITEDMLFAFSGDQILAFEAKSKFSVFDAKQENFDYCSGSDCYFLADIDEGKLYAIGCLRKYYVWDLYFRNINNKMFRVGQLQLGDNSLDEENITIKRSGDTLKIVMKINNYDPNRTYTKITNEYDINYFISRKAN